MRRRVAEVVVLASVVAGLGAALGWWARGQADGHESRGPREAWAAGLCTTDEDCEELEAVLTQLGWIPPAPMFAGDKRPAEAAR